MSVDSDGLTDEGKLLFGAGFVFGVMVTMVILAVVLAVVRSEGRLPAGAGGTLIVTAVGGALFAAIIGIGLYYLAFPANRMRIPVDPGQFEYVDGDDADETDTE